MKKQKKTHQPKLKTLIIITVLVLAAVELLVSHRLATAGQVVRQLELQAESLKKENQVMREKVALGGSLSSLAAKATELGLAKSQKIVSFSPEIPVALRTSK